MLSEKQRKAIIATAKEGVENFAGFLMAHIFEEIDTLIRERVIKYGSSTEAAKLFINTVMMDKQIKKYFKKEIK